MLPEKTRQSLNYSVYIEHARSLKLAADENNRAFYKVAKESMSEENRIKGLGLHRASLALYAISIELILKAVGLYHERGNIISGNIETFNDFLKKIKKKGKTGHEFSFIIETYKIKLSDSELKLINHLQEYTIWAGRFPFPRKEEEIKLLENNTGSHGIGLSLSYIDEINLLIENQIKSLKE